jgi:hypothetical protein
MPFVQKFLDKFTKWQENEKQECAEQLPTIGLCGTSLEIRLDSPRGQYDIEINEI